MRNTSDARDRIIDAFIECTLVLGYDKVNLAEVARVAGVTRPTVYKYFSNITDLYFTAVARVFEGRSDIAAQRLARYRSLERQLTEALVLLNRDSPGDGLYARFLRSIIDSKSVREVPREKREEAQIALMGAALAPIFEAHPHLQKQGAPVVDLFSRLAVSMLFRPFRDEKAIRQTVRMLIQGLEPR
mgnify:CR=1 FL=1